MRKFRWGIFGTGAVSANFVAGLTAAKNHKAVLVASRTQARADWFAAGAGVERAVEGYEEAARSGGVDAVYIATPTREHMSHALNCIQAGLPVLIEKPFASNAAEARSIVSAARKHNVFAMEAMWTRFMPATRLLYERAKSGSVGEMRMVSGSFGTSKRLDATDSTVDAGRAALSQLGVYPISLAQGLFGSPTEMHAISQVGPSGLEEGTTFQLLYPNDVLGSFYCSIRSWAPNDFSVMGTDGVVSFRGPLYRPSGIDLTRQAPRGAPLANFGWKARLRESGLAHKITQWAGTSAASRATKSIRAPFAGNGYHYQAEEVAARVSDGALESPTMSLDESINVAETIDAIRAIVKRSEL